MKDRIFELMKTVGKNPSDFAATIEISPALLSSIKSGRTKPTVYLIEKIKAVYPNVDMNWLMTGEGEMFIGASKQPSLLQENNGQNSASISKNYSDSTEKNDSDLSIAAEPEVNMVVNNISRPKNLVETEHAPSSNIGTMSSNIDTPSSNRKAPSSNISTPTSNSNFSINDDSRKVKNEGPAANEQWYVKTMVSPESKHIAQIVVLYDDGTFETLKR